MFLLPEPETIVIDFGNHSMGEYRLRIYRSESIDLSQRNLVDNRFGKGDQAGRLKNKLPIIVARRPKKIKRMILRAAGGAKRSAQTD